MRIPAGLLLLWAVLALIACTGEAPVEQSLQTLVARDADYAGRRVTTEGVVRSFPDPLHYWVEDDNFQRVGLAPGDRVADHVGHRVRVTGRFGFVEGEGRQIQVEQIERLDIGTD